MLPYGGGRLALKLVEQKVETLWQRHRYHLAEVESRERCATDLYFRDPSLETTVLSIDDFDN
jgi:hypothetical protein